MSQSPAIVNHRTIQIAPMMDYTDRHCRYFFRLISKKAWVFTEMIATGAILHGNRDKLLAYHACEHPISLQIGGSNPNELAIATKIATEYEYDEINLNIGCPSSRVQSGQFGACLMAKPELVAECVAAMQNATSIPISVKTRIGIDDTDSYEFLHQFINTVAQTGCKIFIIHARKAWLKGLNPKQNREIPPLQYETIYQLKSDFKHLTIIINGGIQCLDATEQHLQQVDGVMLGRAAYYNPYLLSTVDQKFYASQLPPPDRQTILSHLHQYIEQEYRQGTAVRHITRHILGLFQGMPGAKEWRRLLSSGDSRKILERFSALG